MNYKGSLKHHVEGAIFSFQLNIEERDVKDLLEKLERPHVINTIHVMEKMERLLKKRVSEAGMSYWNDLTRSRALLDLSYKHKIHGFQFGFQNIREEGHTLMRTTLDREKKGFTWGIGTLSTPILDNFIVRHYLTNNWVRNDRKLKNSKFIGCIAEKFTDKDKDGMHEAISAMDVDRQLYYSHSFGNYTMESYELQKKGLLPRACDS